MRRLTARLFLLFLLISSSAYTATITADTGGGNWSSTATWVGAATPTAADDVALAVTSGPVTVDTGTCLAKSVTATTYVANLAFSAGQTLTVSGNVILGAGQTLSGTGVLSVNQSSTMTSAALTFPGSILLTGGSKTYTLGDTWTVTGSLATGGNSTLNANAMNVGGSLTHTSTLAGTTKLNLNGSGTWSGTSALTCGVTINTSGTVTIANINAGATTITYSAGTVTYSSSILSLSATSVRLNTGTMHWHNILRSNTTGQNITLASNLIADGYIAIPNTTSADSSYAFLGSFNVNCATFTVPGGVNGVILAFAAGTTLTVSTQLIMLPTVGSTGLNLASSMASGTASSSMYLNYTGTPSNLQIMGCSFADVDASPSVQEIWNYFGGTLTRTTNIRNVTLPVPRGFFF